MQRIAALRPLLRLGSLHSSVRPDSLHSSVQPDSLRRFVRPGTQRPLAHPGTQRPLAHPGALRRSRAFLPFAVLLTAAALTGCGSFGATDSATAAATPQATSKTTTASIPTPGQQFSTSPTPTVDPFAGQPLIDNTVWTDTIDGPRLLVHPTPAGRQTTYPGSDERAWQEVLTQAPDADSPGMRDQFLCHWVWARLVQPNKPSWNLEPWRPDVGYQATVDAHCNPGGPER